MWTFLKSNLTTAEFVDCLQAIVDGEDYVWSDFTDVPIKDPELDKIRVRIAALEQSNPPSDSNAYLDPEGLQILRSIIQRLQASDEGRRL